MLDCLDALIQAQIDRIESHPARTLLSHQALTRFREALGQEADMMVQSTVTHLIVEEVGDENPFAALTPDLLTDEQREKALKSLNEKINGGEMALPGPLVDLLRLRLREVTDGFAEMLTRLQENLPALRALLPEEKAFARMEDIGFSAGDTHNHGRSVTILHTDAGKLVYKPHDMRGEAGIYALTQQYFSDVLGIPKCLAFSDQFGVSEFIEKHRSQGEEAARRFWHNMGGAAAVIKMLGSTDMHVENLTCRDDKPFILDLETIVSPELSSDTYKKLHPELRKLKSTSPYLSCLLPSSHEGREFSVLTSTAQEGCAPEIDGENEPVDRFMPEFRAGYTEIYKRILENREAISAAVAAFSAVMPARLLIRNTQFYHDTLVKTWHHNALASEEKRRSSLDLLARIMKNNIRPEFAEAVNSELRQLTRGDIPYVYTYANSGDLYSEGKPVVKDVFERNAEQHILGNLAAMGPADLKFDLDLFDRCIDQYPGKLSEKRRKPPVPAERTEEVLTKAQAMTEAKKLFDTLFAICLDSPDGKRFWGYLNESPLSFRFCETGLTNGLTGIAVFAAAYALLDSDPQVRAQADTAVNEAIIELERMYGYFEDQQFDWSSAPQLGESEGLGGILNGLALLKRYTGRDDIASLQEKALRAVERFDLSRYGAPDRMIGMAGLVSVLCRFEEYRERVDLIRTAAEKLLAMKKLSYKGKLLWKPFPDKERPISGGGHGLAGIAEALYAAAEALGDPTFAEAGAAAMAFEREIYAEKFGTWPDLRSYPPEGYMHGYCSGAPGIGIMAARIQRTGFTSADIEKVAELAAKSADHLPLNARDHLCCGNSAVAEYYMTAGRFEEAGRVLAAMRRRSAAEDSYRYMGYTIHNTVLASLFYGVAGIGYEMLRYACPDKIISVI